MKSLSLLLFLLSWVACTQPAPPSSAYQVVLPGAEEEAQYVWELIRDISFYEEHMYPLSLPQHPFVDSLLAKSREKQLSDQNKDRWKEMFAREIYQERKYEKGHANVLARLPILDSLLIDLKAKEWEWEFRTYEQYPIRLTLYGPGGSYHPEDGSILLFTTPEGGFKQYLDPANTLIHETIHLGIESSLIRPYQVPHPVKERIVDQMVLLLFGDRLPEYRIQQMGVEGFETYVNSPQDLKRLDQRLADFLAE